MLLHIRQEKSLCSHKRERPLHAHPRGPNSGVSPRRVALPLSPETDSSARTLDHARLAAIPARHPELRDDADLAPGRPDKVHPEAKDGLIDGGIGPRGGIFVFGLEHAAGVETPVVDAVPAQLVDRGQEIDIVLLVGSDEDCGPQTGRSTTRESLHAHQAQVTFRIPRRVG